MKAGLFYVNVTEGARLAGRDERSWLAQLAAGGMDYLECDWSGIRSKPETFFEMLWELGIGISVYVRCDRDGCLLNEEGLHIHGELPAMVSRGIRHVMPVFFAKAGEDPKSDEVKQSIVESTEKLVALAESLGLCITFEDYDAADIPCGSCRELLEFADRIPGLQFTLDTGNFQFHGERLLECLPLLAGKIAHVHVKDRTGPEPAAPTAVTGQGVLPIREALHWLYEQGCDGWCTAELFGVEPSMENLLFSVNYVKDHFC